MSEQNPALQFDNLHEYARRAELTIIGEYCDIAVSGRKEGRPQLNALMKAARNRETLYQRSGSDRHRQSNGQGHVYYHQRYG